MSADIPPAEDALVHPDRLVRLKTVLTHARSLPDAERRVFLEVASRDEPEIARDVDVLLAHDVDPDDIRLLLPFLRGTSTRPDSLPPDAHNARVYRLFDEVVSLEGAERESHLEHECSDEPDVRREVEKLLALAVETADLPVRPLVEQTAGTPTGGRLSGAVSVPEQVGRYRVVGTLGSGGMGVVYLGEDDTLGRQVAIKMVHGVSSGQERALRRFEKEARLLASLNHPNIATLYSLEREPPHVFLTMEVIEGCSLAERLQDGPLRIDEALAVGRELALAIEAAHARAIVHRDLKPSNVMLTTAGTVKVLDFGLAKLAEVADAVASSGETGASMPGGATEVTLTRVAGTPGYMSPEQVRGESADHRADIWAYGCLLYEILTGNRVFGGSTADARLHATLALDPDLERLPKDVPTAIRELVASCLQKDITTRLGSIVEARRVITRTIEARKRSTTTRRMRVLWTVTALLVVAVVSLLLVRGTAVDEGPVATQLTRRPADVYINHAEISPDGRSVLICESGRPVLLQDIETQVMRELLLPEGTRSSGTIAIWHPTRDVVLTPLWKDTEYDMWFVSPSGGGELAFPELDRQSIGGSWSPMLDLAMSPDGRLLLNKGPGHGTWIIVPGETAARQILPGVSLASATWSPTGQVIAFKESASGVSVVTMDADGNTHVIIEPSDGRLAAAHLNMGELRSLLWLPDGRLIFTRAMAPPDAKSTELWSVEVEPTTGVRLGDPERFAGWVQWVAGNVTSSRAGDRLALIRRRTDDEVLRMALAEDGRSAGEPVRVTFDYRSDRPGVWTLDGRYLFASERYGTYDVLATTDGSTAPRKLLTGPDDERPICLTPTGSHVLVRVSEPGRHWLSSGTSMLLRVPLSGDQEPSPVMTLDPNEEIACATDPDGSCVLMRFRDAEVAFHRLDDSWQPDRVLGRTDIDELQGWFGFDWALSPDGHEIAVVYQDGRARFLDVASGTWREVRASRRGWDHITYANDGESLYITRWSSRAPTIDRLWHDGTWETVWDNHYGHWMSAPQVSPEGDELRFGIRFNDGDVWMLEKF